LLGNPDFSSSRSEDGTVKLNVTSFGGSSTSKHEQEIKLLGSGRDKTFDAYLGSGDVDQPPITLTGDHLALINMMASFNPAADGGVSTLPTGGYFDCNLGLVSGLEIPSQIYRVRRPDMASRTN
jgi:hypothetical protein